MVSRVGGREPTSAPRRAQDGGAPLIRRANGARAETKSSSLFAARPLDAEENRDAKAGLHHLNPDNSSRGDAWAPPAREPRVASTQGSRRTCGNHGPLRDTLSGMHRSWTHRLQYARRSVRSPSCLRRAFRADQPCSSSGTLRTLQSTQVRPRGTIPQSRSGCGWRPCRESTRW